jgi:WhiB family transcriptional regulator, redox-sensing transcriptional regulator
LENRVISADVDAIVHPHPSTLQAIGIQSANEADLVVARAVAGGGRGIWITDWTTRAACKGTDPDELFVQGAAQNRAKLICRGCPVRTECLADALDNGIEFGVWGGMTEKERRALLRRRPDVQSWRVLLERAGDEYERGQQDAAAESA